MEEENNGYVGFACFFFFIVLLVAAGTFLIYKEHTSNLQKDNEKVTLYLDKLKKDKDKEFIYYENEEKISNDLNYTLKKAIINIDSEDAVEVNRTLDELYTTSLEEVKKSSEENSCENQRDLYSASVTDYATYINDKYITLLISTSNYTCLQDLSTINKIESYTFDATTGKLVSSNDLLKQFDFSYTTILENLENHLNEMKNTINEDILVEEILSQLRENENYTIYVSDNDKLVINYIVKTKSYDYNDIIELI